MKSMPAVKVVLDINNRGEDVRRARLLARVVALSVILVALNLFVGGKFASTALAQATTAQILHNEDIIQMVHAKLSDGVIVAKIKSSRCKFDTSTDQLIKLKSEGVSNEVLKAMAECGTTTAADNLSCRPEQFRLAAPSGNLSLETGVGNGLAEVTYTA